MFRALRTWLYDGDPLAPLAFEAPLAAVRKALDEDPDYLTGMIRRYLLDNPHRTTLHLVPDATYNQTRDAEEQDALDRRRARPCNRRTWRPSSPTPRNSSGCRNRSIRRNCWRCCPRSS